MFYGTIYLIFLLNYNSEKIVFLETETSGFDLKKFAPYVHSGNILDISEELNTAMYHIERNGNAKVILLDVSIKLTRLLHTKEAKINKILLTIRAIIQELFKDNSVIIVVLLLWIIISNLASFC